MALKKPVKPCNQAGCSYHDNCPYQNKDGIRDRAKCIQEQYGEDIVEVD